MKPTHIHDCDVCQYLGTESINGWDNDTNIDFYYCGNKDENPCLHTLIARYSSEGGDYSSGLEFVMASIPLNTALRLGIEKGIIPQNVQEYIKRRQIEWFQYLEGDERYKLAMEERWKNHKRFTL